MSHAPAPSTTTSTPQPKGFKTFAKRLFRTALILAIVGLTLYGADQKFDLFNRFWDPPNYEADWKEYSKEANGLYYKTKIAQLHKDFAKTGDPTIWKEIQALEKEHDENLKLIDPDSQPAKGNESFPAPDPTKVFIYPTNAQSALPQLPSPDVDIQKNGDTHVVTFPAKFVADTEIPVTEGQTITILGINGLVHMQFSDKSYISPLVGPTTGNQAEPEDFEVQGTVGSVLMYVDDTVIDLATTRSAKVPHDGILRFGINSRKKWPNDPTGGFTVNFKIE